jgi:hypothetical protein
MTREQFVATVVKAADPGHNRQQLLMQFVKAKAQALYDPALEDQDTMLIQNAIKPFAISAECLDDLVAALTQMAIDMAEAKRRNAG